MDYGEPLTRREFLKVAGAVGAYALIDIFAPREAYAGELTCGELRDDPAKVQKLLGSYGKEHVADATWLLKRMPNAHSSRPASELVENVVYARKVKPRMPEGKTPDGLTHEELYCEFVLPDQALREPPSRIRKRLYEAIAPRAYQHEARGGWAREANQWVDEKLFCAWEWYYTAQVLKQRIRSGAATAGDIERCRECEDRWREFMAVNRDALTALDILTQGYELCQGETILAVLAERSIAIPAAGVSTPWWPHKAGNHCWLEAFYGGEWHDFDAGHPTGSVRGDASRAAVIHRHRYGLPLEDITGNGRYTTAARASLVLPKGCDARSLEALVAGAEDPRAVPAEKWHPVARAPVQERAALLTLGNNRVAYRVRASGRTSQLFTLTPAMEKPEIRLAFE